MLEERGSHVQKAILTLLAGPWESHSFAPLPQFAQGLGEAHTNGSDAVTQELEKPLFILFPVLLSRTQKDISPFAQVQSCHFLQRVENLKGVVREIKFRMLFLSYFILPVLQVIQLKWRRVLWWVLLSSHWNFEKSSNKLDALLWWIVKGQNACFTEMFLTEKKLHFQPKKQL